MTEREAILRIMDHITIHKINEPHAEFLHEALEMAMEALRTKGTKHRWKDRAIRAEADYEKARNHATNLTRRVKALTTALLTVPTTACYTCMHAEKDRDDYPCVDCVDYAKQRDAWEFDEDRFVEKG